jgi:hypothetical protein
MDLADGAGMGKPQRRSNVAATGAATARAFDAVRSLVGLLILQREEILSLQLRCSSRTLL